MIFRIYHETAGDHVHMRVFAGKRDALGKCGDLTMRVEEFKEFIERFGHQGAIDFRPEQPGKSLDETLGQFMHLSGYNQEK